MKANSRFISAIIPVIGGITAPPTIAVIIRPDISLVLSGNVSIVIEKTSGNLPGT